MSIVLWFDLVSSVLVLKIASMIGIHFYENFKTKLPLPFKGPDRHP